MKKTDNYSLIGDLDIVQQSWLRVFNGDIYFYI